MTWRVRRRQATFWDFESPESTQRIHFVGKLEHHFVSNYADSIEVKDDHPVLVNYRNPWADIYISTAPLNPGTLSAALLRSVQAKLGEWRVSTEYFNHDVEPSVLLEGGFGLLFSGPAPLAAVVQHTLNAADVRFTALPRHHSLSSAKALIAGKNFVVARDFRFGV